VCAQTSFPERCQVYGGLGQPCCDSGACDDPDAVCSGFGSSQTCVKCGIADADNPRAPCCAGNQCEVGCCSSTSSFDPPYCVASGAACDPAQPAAGVCDGGGSFTGGTCGSLGEPCCTASGYGVCAGNGLTCATGRRHQGHLRRLRQRGPGLLREPGRHARKPHVLREPATLLVRPRRQQRLVHPLTSPTVPKSLPDSRHAVQVIAGHARERGTVAAPPAGGERRVPLSHTKASTRGGDGASFFASWMPRLGRAEGEKLAPSLLESYGAIAMDDRRRTWTFSRPLFGLCLSLGLSVPRPAAADAPDSTPTTQEADPPDDGWPDLSAFLDQKYGFLPVAMPITEPAVGYGAAIGTAFLSKPLGAARAGLGRPNITAAGGMATENGTWGAFIGDMRYWLDDRLQTLAGAILADVNLDFHGIGKNSALAGDPLHYTLNPMALALQAKYRFGDTRIWAGLSYAFAFTGVSFDAAADASRLPDFDRDSRVGGLTVLGSYDSRDSLFTPLRGTFVELSFGFFGKALGGQDTFERGALVAIQYVPLPWNLFLGLRGDVGATFGDAPFYLKPFTHLRGVPIMRYQGEQIAQAETELRWQFWGRLSLLGFVGAGAAWNDFERLDDSTTVIAGGPGIRYELARRYGIHMGIDVAFSRDTTAFYVQVGNAWLRP
jgi:hypothetical protein